MHIVTYFLKFRFGSSLMTHSNCLSCMSCPLMSRLIPQNPHSGQNPVFLFLLGNELSRIQKPLLLSWETWGSVQLENLHFAARNWGYDWVKILRTGFIWKQKQVGQQLPGGGEAQPLLNTPLAALDPPGDLWKKYRVLGMNSQRVCVSGSAVVS